MSVRWLVAGRGEKNGMCVTPHDRLQESALEPLIGWNQPSHEVMEVLLGYPMTQKVQEYQTGDLTVNVSGYTGEMVVRPTQVR